MWRKCGTTWEYRNSRGQTVARVAPTRSGWRWETLAVRVEGGYLRFSVVASGACPGGAKREGKSFLTAQERALSYLNK